MPPASGVTQVGDRVSGIAYEIRWKWERKEGTEGEEKNDREGGE